jgi:hypothetical protein
VANTSLRAAVTAGGSFLLAGEAADVGEGRPLDNAAMGVTGSFMAENATAFPLVTGTGVSAIAWTGAVADNRHVGVKAARLTSSGLRAVQESWVDGSNVVARRRGVRTQRR